MNPVLDNVPAAFERVAVRPRSLTIDRKGVVLPEGGHFQGIQRIGTQRQRLVITSSSDSQAYFVMCDIAADGVGGRAQAPVRLSGPPLDHAGGCQAVGNFLAVGVEDNDSRRKSEIQFWNIESRPAQVTSLTIRRSGAEKVSTAGAVGLSSYRSGAALAVATWDADTIDFYASIADPFLVSRARFQFCGTWTKAGTNKTGWIDDTVGSYQSVNLLTQRDGKLYLIGFHRDGGDDWMDLFAVNLDASPATMLEKVARKHMFCSDGCSFQDGAGVYVPSSSHFEVYAVKGLSGDHKTGTTIHANHFGLA